MGFCRITVVVGTADGTKDMGSCWPVLLTFRVDAVISWPGAVTACSVFLPE